MERGYAGTFYDMGIIPFLHLVLIAPLLFKSFIELHTDDLSLFSYVCYISVFKNYILIIFNPMLSLLEFWRPFLCSSFLYNSIFHTYLNKESNLPGIITDCIRLVQGLEFNINSDLLFTYFKVAWSYPRVWRVKSCLPGL